MAAPCFLVIKAVGVVEMLKIYIFTEEGNELELETNVSKRLSKISPHYLCHGVVKILAPI